MVDAIVEPLQIELRPQVPRKRTRHYLELERVATDLKILVESLSADAANAAADVYGTVAGAAGHGSPPPMFSLSKLNEPDSGAEEMYEDEMPDLVSDSSSLSESSDQEEESSEEEFFQPARPLAYYQKRGQLRKSL